MPKKKSNPESYLTLSNRGRAATYEVRLENETVWLTIDEMADLFQINKSGISRHLKNIFETNELQQDATVAKIATVRQEGTRNIERQSEYYNLDAIIFFSSKRRGSPGPSTSQ